MTQIWPDEAKFEWWDSVKAEDGTVVRYEGFERSLQALEEACAAHAPIHGIVGFSQGGILASLVGALSLQGKTTVVPQCLILISTMKARDPKLGAALRPEAPLNIPTVHLIGEKDTAIPAEVSESLGACFQGAITIKHPRGHQVPRLDEAQWRSLHSVLGAVDPSRRFVKEIAPVDSEDEEITVC